MALIEAVHGGCFVLMVLLQQPYWTSRLRLARIRHAFLAICTKVCTNLFEILYFAFWNLNLLFRDAKRRFTTVQSNDAHFGHPGCSGSRKLVRSPLRVALHRISWLCDYFSHYWCAYNRIGPKSRPTLYWYCLVTVAAAARSAGNPPPLRGKARLSDARPVASLVCCACRGLFDTPGPPKVPRPRPWGRRARQRPQCAQQHIVRRHCSVLSLLPSPHHWITEWFEATRCLRPTPTTHISRTKNNWPTQGSLLCSWFSLCRTVYLFTPYMYNIDYHESSRPQSL